MLAILLGTRIKGFSITYMVLLRSDFISEYDTLCKPLGSHMHRYAFKSSFYILFLCFCISQILGNNNSPHSISMPTKRKRLFVICECSVLVNVKSFCSKIMLSMNLKRQLDYQTNYFLVVYIIRRSLKLLLYTINLHITPIILFAHWKICVY